MVHYIIYLNCQKHQTVAKCHIGTDIHVITCILHCYYNGQIYDINELNLFFEILLRDSDPSRCVHLFSIMQYIFVQNGSVFTFTTELRQTSNSSFHLLKLFLVIKTYIILCKMTFQPNYTLLSSRNVLQRLCTF